jgi:hypothetical protein
LKCSAPAISMNSRTSWSVLPGEEIMSKKRRIDTEAVKAISDEISATLRASPLDIGVRLKVLHQRLDRAWA